MYGQRTEPRARHSTLRSNDSKASDQQNEDTSACCLKNIRDRHQGHSNGGWIVAAEESPSYAGGRSQRLRGDDASLGWIAATLGGRVEGCPPASRRDDHLGQSNPTRRQLGLREGKAWWLWVLTRLCELARGFGGAPANKIFIRLR